MTLGEIHQVPCVRTIWSSISERPLWLPVNGPLHDDEEIINTPFPHWHLDWRFLSREQMNTLREHGYASHSLPREAEVFMNVISDVHPDLGEEWQRENYRRTGEDGWVALEDLPRDDIPTESYLQLKPRRLNGEYPEYPSEFMAEHWLPELEEAYRHHRIKQSLVCPHKGGDLAGSRVVNGTVTCPLHGLRWDLRTGKLAPRADDEEEEEPGTASPGESAVPEYQL